MFLAELLKFFLGSWIILPPAATDGLPSATAEPVSLAEVNTYDCARSITTMVDSDLQPGPVFAAEGLIFSSIETKGGGVVLMVSSGAGLYALNLARRAVNRVRFELPARDAGPSTRYFMSFAHGDLLRSRFFEFGAGKPPMGREELDYHWVKSQRSPQLLAHLNYTIYSTSENMLSDIADGKIDRRALSRHRTAGCDHLMRASNTLAGGLRHNVNLLEMIVMGPTAVTPSAPRLPASALER